MKNPKVSVIIPVYNGEKYLKETIDSVLKQTYQDFEIIIVDDASTDSSPEIIRSFIKKYPDKIKLFWHKKNKGCPAATKNTGIKHAKGDFIAFLDQDDVWLPRKLEKQINILKSNDRLIANFTNGYIFDDPKNKAIAKRWAYITPFPDFYVVRKRLLKENFILSSSSALVRAKILKKAGGFDEKMKLADDYDLWFRLTFYGKFSFIQEPLFNWRFHTESLSFNEEKHINDLIYFFKKILSNDKLAKEEKNLAKIKKSLYIVRLANFYLDRGKIKQAKEIYSAVAPSVPNYGLVKIILFFLKTFPCLARQFVKVKRTYSAKSEYWFERNINLNEENKTKANNFNF